MNNSHQSNCIFCKIVNKEINSHLILESEHTIAVLDAFPLSTGHALIITKKHYPNLSLTNDLVLGDAVLMCKKISLMLEKTFPNIKGFNYLSNQNQIASQTVFHTHFHVIPKYDKNTGFCFEEKRVPLNDKHENVLEKMKKNTGN